MTHSTNSHLTDRECFLHDYRALSDHDGGISSENILLKNSTFQPLKDLLQLVEFACTVWPSDSGAEFIGMVFI